MSPHSWTLTLLYSPSHCPVVWRPRGASSCTLCHHLAYRPGAPPVTDSQTPAAAAAAVEAMAFTCPPHRAPVRFCRKHSPVVVSRDPTTPACGLERWLGRSGLDTLGLQVKRGLRHSVCAILLFVLCFCGRLMTSFVLVAFCYYFCFDDAPIVKINMLH